MADSPEAPGIVIPQNIVWADTGEFQVWFAVYAEALKYEVGPTEAAKVADETIRIVRERKPLIGQLATVANHGGR